MAETLTRYHRERYGVWGYQKGEPVDPMRCAEEIHRGFRVWPPNVQCSRKRGHGPDGAFCKQHARQHEARDD